MTFEWMASCKALVVAVSSGGVVASIGLRGLMLSKGSALLVLAALRDAICIPG